MRTDRGAIFQAHPEGSGAGADSGAQIDVYHGNQARSDVSIEGV